MTWNFITRDDYDRFLTEVVVTDGGGGIAGYRLDIGKRGVVRVQVRHRLRNAFRPWRREGIAVVLQDTIDRESPEFVRVEVVASYMPLWLRRKR